MKLSEDRWRELSARLDEGLDLPAEERAEWLEGLAGFEPELKGVLGDVLLRGSGNFGTLPQLGEAVPDVACLVPAVIGGYRILRVIGEGGMGTVYEAAQEQPSRTVALKVLKPGRRTPELLWRFTQESQSLARLQHPGVAQIFAAGVSDSGFGPQPWFAMEYIFGLTLPAFAAERDLDLAARVALLIKVCDAVQHAHVRGIIHRDLKPANILVDGSGQPKVLDFGVARMTGGTESAEQTRAGELVGTLAWMSPEQLSGDPLEVDARSDVYSLGVLLYQLLAGQMPYRLTGRLPMDIHAIREEEPAMLGSLVRGCRGDLETITARALAKDKSRRYGSAADLAADLGRHLRNEPVLARAPAAGYRLRKFAARHKAVAIALPAALVALSIGLVAASRESLRANREEKAALLDRDRARQAGETAGTERERAEREREEAERERKRAVDEARRADSEAASARAVSDFLEHDVLSPAGPRAQFKGAGEGKATPFDTELTVRAALDRAAANIAGKFGGQPAVEASVRQAIGRAYSDLELLAPAEKQMEIAVRLRLRTLGAESGATLASMNELGQIYTRKGKYREAEKTLRTTFEARRKTLGERDPLTLDTLSALSTAIAKGRADHGTTESLLARAAELQITTRGPDDGDSLALLHNLAAEYSNAGKYPQAEALYRQVLESKIRLLGAQHPSTVATMSGLAVAERYLGQYEEARKLLESVLQARRATFGTAHPETVLSVRSMGLLYQAEGRLDQAEALLVEALRTSREISGETHPDTLAAMNSVAELYRLREKYPESETLFRQVLAARRLSLPADHPFVTGVISSLGWIRLELGDFSEGETLLSEALDGQRKKTPDSWRRYYSESLLGACLAGLGRKAEGAELMNSGLKGLVARWDSMPFENRVLVEEARRRLARL